MTIALLQTSAQPGRQAFADEAAVLDRDACDADVEIGRRRFVLEQLDLFGIDGQLHRHHQVQREQDRDAHRQVEPQRQHVVPTPAGQILPNRLVRPEEQRREGARERAFDREVGVTELLRELAERRRPDRRLLSARRVERRPRRGKGRAAVEAGGRRGGIDRARQLAASFRSARGRHDASALATFGAPRKSRPIAISLVAR